MAIEGVTSFGELFPEGVHILQLAKAQAFIAPASEQFETPEEACLKLLWEDDDGNILWDDWVRIKFGTRSKLGIRLRALVPKYESGMPYRIETKNGTDDLPVRTSNDVELDDVTEFIINGESMFGKICQIQVEHVKKGDATYANIVGVMPVPGASRPKGAP